MFSRSTEFQAGFDSLQRPRFPAGNPNAFPEAVKRIARRPIGARGGATGGVKGSDTPSRFGAGIWGSDSTR